MKKKTPSKKPTLTLHQLLGALSFWGTATRALLFGFIALITFVIALSEASTNAAVDAQIYIFIYVLGSFLLLDFGYVMIARAYPLQRALDVLVLYVADIFLALLYVVPKLVVSSQVQLKVDPLIYVLFVPLVVLALRMLAGFLFGGKR